MSTTKHMPTPWIVNGRLILGPNLDFIASTSDCGQEQNEANAEFIIRACNSHERLQETLRKYGQHLPDCNLLALIRLTKCNGNAVGCTCGFEAAIAAAEVKK